MRVLPENPVPQHPAPPGSDSLDPYNLIGMTRLGATAVSPDGSLAVLSAKRYDWAAKKNHEQLWLMDLAAAAGMTDDELQAHRHLTQLTATEHKSNHSPQFSPCGGFVAWLSDRSGRPAVWIMPVRRAGEPRQLADLPVGVGDLQWVKEPDCLIVSAEVLAEGGEDPMQTTADAKKAREESGVSARLYSSLPVRRWDQWVDDSLTHPFVLPLELIDGAYCLANSGDLAPARDLLSGVLTHCPQPPFGGCEDWAVGPACATQMLAVSVRAPLANDEAWSTNRHIYLRPLVHLPLDAGEGGLGLLGECVSEGNPGYDTNPVFSPDGTRLAWLSMATPGYEADAQRIKMLDLETREIKTLAPEWPYSPDDLNWSASGERLFFSSSINARTALCSLDLSSGEITVLQGAAGANSLCAEISQTEQLLVKRHSLTAPAELFIRSSFASLCDVDMRQLTFFNQTKLASIRFGDVEEIHFAGAKSEQAWFIRPSGWQPNKNYPLAVIIHGGPQGAIGDGWHYRWNLQSYATQGFAVLAINFHGSTGFGHAFCRSISGDWGGAPADDIVLGCQHALERFPWLDKQRVAGLGASYGGFMVNWLNGYAPEGMFACLVNHDGCFSFEASYYSTEELFFMEYEFQGTPWEAAGNPQSPYARFSPHTQVHKWRTPTLVIHGGKDFRLVETEGIATFQALQRQGVPSEFLYFPSENHWCLSAQNSVVWHEKVLAWIVQWTAM